ncbi:MAG: Rieske 2Fe-2S domain-containing protein [Bacteroidota bacterium]
MTRKEFLSTLGIGATFVLTSTCLGGCATDELTDEDMTPSTNTNTGSGLDFTLDLTDPEYAALQDTDSFVIVDKVVVARTTTGDYIAATVVCSHAQLEQIRLRDDEWYCTAHGARYDLEGDGLNENGRRGLTIYNTEIDGNMLRVFA